MFLHCMIFLKDPFRNSVGDLCGPGIGNCNNGSNYGHFHSCFCIAMYHCPKLLLVTLPTPAL